MKGKVFIGCSGFSESLWKGFFYAEDLPSKDYLKYYSGHLNSVEINSTFYRRPRPTTIQKWYEQSPEDFRFFIKVHKYFSHNKRMQDCKDELTVFCDNISKILKEKLAGFLFQMPPSFKYSEENLQRIIETADKNYLNVVEFRHNSWWNQTVLDKLKKHEIIFCGVSFPKGIPDDVMVNSDDAIYYRLHGVPELFKSEYSEEELDKLATEIKKFNGIKYIYFNNTFGIAGIKNALYLDKILK